MKHLHRPWLPLFYVSFLLAADALDGAPGADTLELHTRARRPLSPGSKSYQVAEGVAKWAPTKTAIIVCDMWDKHWCKGATERVGEMAPRMNQVLQAARRRGVLILHAPSSTMAFYADYPQRKRAQQAPKAPAPHDLGQWLSLNLAKEAPLPIDDADGGCDDQPTCPSGSPWRHEIAALEIAPEDVISDQGDEVYNVLQARGIDNVIVMGVHANMCVLGRPFSIRQMVSLGKHVVLMRDMTDTMYNSRQRPYVGHFVGTDLVVEHIEKYWCPSITSVDFLGGEPFRFKADHRPHVVFLIGEPEYDTKRTLPEFAQSDLARRGFRCSFVTNSDASPNDFHGLESIQDADLLVVSVRRHTPTQAQMAFIRRHLESGKPLLGIRTASHAFDAEPPDAQHAAWRHFDLEVLGAHYLGHYNNQAGAGPATLVTPIPSAAQHPILAGLPAAGFRAASNLYRSRDLATGVTPLLLGQLEGRSEQEPVAWVNTGSQRRVFYTSLGSPGEFQIPAFRRLLLNSICWCLDLPVPKET